MRKFMHFNVLRAECGQLPVVLGAAPAADLLRLSFADALDESTGHGYQRPFDQHHSREFREYIDGPDATTIPLTFNLRGTQGTGWKLEPVQEPLLRLSIGVPNKSFLPVLSRVDCQHRLGMMEGSSVPLTFQCYLGLSASQEMAIFNTINSKAKGLSSSLLDYHSTKLIQNLDAVRPDLFIAKKLHDDPKSVWHGAVKLGGAPGCKRRVSLRGLQSAVALILERSPLGTTPIPTDRKYEVVRSFWEAASKTWPTAWSHPRSHLLTKGVGLNALSLLAVDILAGVLAKEQAPSVATFADCLRPLSGIDWSNDGPFKGFGGRNGAKELHRNLQSQIFTRALALA